MFTSYSCYLIHGKTELKSTVKVYRKAVQSKVGLLGD